jgi:hypothetical protein
MKQYDNTNRGVLFKNDRKTKDTQPGYTGTLNVDGVEYFLDAWLKDGQRGKFFSVSVKRKEQQNARQEQRAPARQAQGSGFDDMDSDIPFVTASSYYDETTSKARRMARYDF